MYPCGILADRSSAQPFFRCRRSSSGGSTLCFLSALLAAEGVVAGVDGARDSMEGWALRRYGHRRHMPSVFIDLLGDLSDPGVKSVPCLETGVRLRSPPQCREGMRVLLATIRRGFLEFTEYEPGKQKS